MISTSPLDVFKLRASVVGEYSEYVQSFINILDRGAG